MMHIGHFDDPFGYYGNMPEIPEQRTGDEHRDIHLLGCLHVAIGLLTLFIILILTAVALWFLG